MITPTTLRMGSALQTSPSGSSGGVSLELVLLLGVAAVVVIALAWMLAQSGSSSD